MSTVFLEPPGSTILTLVLRPSTHGRAAYPAADTHAQWKTREHARRHRAHQTRLRATRPWSNAPQSPVRLDTEPCRAAHRTVRNCVDTRRDTLTSTFGKPLAASARTRIDGAARTTPLTRTQSGQETFETLRTCPSGKSSRTDFDGLNHRSDRNPADRSPDIGDRQGDHFDPRGIRGIRPACAAQPLCVNGGVVGIRVRYGTSVGLSDQPKAGLPLVSPPARHRRYGTPARQRCGRRPADRGDRRAIVGFRRNGSRRTRSGQILAFSACAPVRPHGRGAG